MFYVLFDAKSSETNFTLEKFKEMQRPKFTKILFQTASARFWPHCDHASIVYNQWGAIPLSLALGRCKWPQIVNDPKITEWPNPASVS